MLRLLKSHVDDRSEKQGNGCLFEERIWRYFGGEVWVIPIDKKEDGARRRKIIKKGKRKNRVVYE